MVSEFVRNGTMACCEWDTFKDGFLGVWRQAKHNPSPLLIDWKQAEHLWRRHHCTGGEAARVQISALSEEANFLWAMKPPHEGTPHCFIPQPCHASPVAANLIASELLNRLRERK